MAKAPDAFRTISEVSESLDTPAHVLRFWESKFTQVKPVKRAGGRRYYRPEDLALLGGIKVLLHDHGMTIKGAQKVLREQGVKAVAALSPNATSDDGDVIDAKAEQPQAISEPVAPVAQTPEAAAALADDDAPREVQAPEPDVAPPVLADRSSAVAESEAENFETLVDATPPPAPDAPVTDTPTESQDDQASVAADNVVAMPSLPREEPIPRKVPPPRALAWLAASDRAAVRRNAAAIAPVRDRLAAVHRQMTKA